MTVSGGLQSSFEWTLLFILLSLFLGGLVFIVYSIRKLGYNWKQVLKSIIISIVVGFLVNVLLFLIFQPRVLCDVSEIGAYSCQNSFDIFTGTFYFITPAISFILMIIYFIFQLIRNRGR